MAVNLSPVGGVAAQFFTNSGAILTGGKIFTYAAGTTTPQATFTSASGSVPHSNPIILDASGRVPGGEIWLTDGSVYKFLLKDANDVLIGTYDNISGINDGTNITVSANNVTYTPAGAGAVPTTVQAKLRESVSVKDFGAVGDGVADDTAAIQSALNTSHTVLLPQGTYKITAQLVFGATCSGLVGEGMYLSVISKEFNGNAILCDTNGAIIQHLGIDGNGATYTDGGIVPRGYNILIQHCRINDTADSPIKVAGAVGSNNLAATYLRVDSCFLAPTNATTTYAIRSITADDSIRPTSRVFSNISGGSSLVDFSGMNYAVLENSLGSIIKFDNNCSKVQIFGCRFTNATANITIFGQDHVIDNNAWSFGSGFGLTIDATAGSVYFGANNNIVIGTSSFSSITDGTPLNGPNLNNLSTNLKPFTFAWYGSVTNPTLGNSPTTAWYKQEGRTCWATLSFIRGTTATLGSGVYTFQLPFEAYVDARGTVLVESSSGTYYVGVLVVIGGTSTASCYFHSATGAWTSGDFAFSNNSTFEATITYLIAPT